MGNSTTVTAGAMAGALASILWWGIGEFTTVAAPEAIVAASVVLFTAAIQYALKSGSDK